MVFLTVAMICILSCCEMDLFIPALSNIREDFAISPFAVEMLVSANLASFCIFTLLAGSLGDKYGRKEVLVAGLLLFLLGSIPTIIATSFELLLLGRVIQGIGISSTVLGYVIIADTCGIREQQRKLGYLNTIVTVSMALAPVIGSQITAYHGWKVNFMALFALGLLTLIMTLLFIPQGTHNSDKHIRLIRDYLPLLRSTNCRNFMLYLSFLGVPYWTYAAIVPIIYVEDMGVSIVEFGFYQGANALSFATGSLFIGHLVKLVGEKKLTNWSTIVIIVLEGVLFLSALLGVGSALYYTIVTCVIALLIVAPFTVTYPYLLESYRNAKARIAAMAQSLRLVFTALAVQLVSFYHDSTMLPLAVVMLVFMGFATVAYFFLLRRGVIWRDDAHQSILMRGD